MTQAQMYRHTRILAAPAKRATPDEAQVLHRLAAKAVALAAEYGETLTFAEGLQRARENMAEVRTMALAKEVVG